MTHTQIVREALDQSILDLSYYAHLATKAKTNNKWIDCEVYKVEMTIDRLNKTLSALEGMVIISLDRLRPIVSEVNNVGVGEYDVKIDFEVLNVPKGMVLVPVEPTEEQATALSEKLGLFVDLENAEPEWIDNAVNTLHGCVIAPYVGRV